jgi:hypothetical protein
MLAIGGYMYGIYTFSPKNPSADQLKIETAKLKTASKRVFNRGYKELSAFVNGTIRFMGLTYSYHNGFNSHLHIVLHLTRKVTEQEAKHIYDLLNERFLKFMDIDSVQSHLAIYS